jgi:ketosteroid isomerase-like protein
MKFARVIAAALLFGSLPAVAAPPPTSTTQQLTTLLRQFLDAAGRSDRPTFVRFFADDVIYTRSTGVVVTKPEILENISKRSAEGTSTYAAEDITVHEYGDTAVVAFRLEGRTERADKSIEAAHYRNTGTFLRRNGQWQVIAWQATKIGDAAH